LIPNIDTQMAAVSEAWPTFEAERIDDRTANWHGRLKPLLQSYEVLITYRAPYIIERLDPLRQQPRVRILAPRLKHRPGHHEGDLPHVYWDDPISPALCLFDHETGEWTPFSLLADTTIPWTVDWLGCYEGWRATGEWTGGGRHAAPIPEQKATP
jgi:hypothetical protein